MNTATGPIQPPFPRRSAKLKVLEPRPARPIAKIRTFVQRKSMPGVRPRSVGNERLTRVERDEMETIFAELTAAGVDMQRPGTIAECPTGICPWVSCRYHLFLDVDEVTHAVKLNFPDKDIDEVNETCALRVAQQVGLGETLPVEQVGGFLNLTVQRIYQLEANATEKMRRHSNVLNQPSE